MNTNNKNNINDTNNVNNTNEEPTVAILVDAKEEYIYNMVEILRPTILRTIKNLYHKSEEICYNENTPDNILMLFQDKCSQIPKWSINEIDKKYNECCKKSKCDYLDDLIKLLFITQIRILSLVHNMKPKSQINIQCPNGKSFMFLCFVEVARECWKQPYLLNKYNGKIEYQKNILVLEDIIDKSIRKSFKNKLPIKSLIEDYFDLSSNVSYINSNSQYQSSSQSTSQSTSQPTSQPNITSLDNISHLENNKENKDEDVEEEEEDVDIMNNDKLKNSNIPEFDDMPELDDLEEEGKEKSESKSTSVKSIKSLFDNIIDNDNKDKEEEENEPISETPNEETSEEEYKEEIHEDGDKNEDGDKEELNTSSETPYKEETQTPDEEEIHDEEETHDEDETPDEEEIYYKGEGNVEEDEVNKLESENINSSNVDSQGKVVNAQDNELIDNLLHMNKFKLPESNSMLDFDIDELEEFDPNNLEKNRKEVFTPRIKTQRKKVFFRDASNY